MKASEFLRKAKSAPGILALQGIKKSFDFWQRLGLHVTPNHYYEPIPDTRKLGSRLWQSPSALVGIDMREDQQLAFLDSIRAYREEYSAFPVGMTDIPYQYYLSNRSFGSVDAEILYCMIRHHKPRRIFEIGSGFSTYLSAQALLANQSEGGHLGELVAFEPYPSHVLRQGFPGLTSLVPTPIERIPLEEFNRLQSGDILFIDSSHVLRIGSDVQYEYLEVLPRLNPGVLIHVHDIFMPAEYPEKWVKEYHIFWSEQYLLQAFLMFNDSFEVLWGGSYMSIRHPQQLSEAIPSYRPDKVTPGSF